MVDSRLIRQKESEAVNIDFTGEEYNSILVAAKIGIWAIEVMEGKPAKLFCNEIMEDLIGVPHGTTPEACYEALMKGLLPESNEDFRRYTSEILEKGSSEITYKWHHPDGRYMSVRCVAVLDSKYEGGYRSRGYHQDITTTADLEKKYAKLVQEVERDGQTGLFCRSAAEGRIREAVRTDNNSSALMLIDVDNLKTINNYYGRSCGDEVINCVVAAMKEVGEKRPDDIIGRFYGDGFIVLIDNVSTVEELADWTETFRKRVSGSRLGPKKNIIPTLSIGIAFFEVGGGYADMYRRADIALYFAKADGKNTFKIYTDDMRQFKLNDRVKELEETNSAMREQLEIVGAMAKVSFNTYLMDLRANTIKTLKKDDTLMTRVSETEPLDKQLEMMISRFDGVQRDRLNEICGTPAKLKALVKNRDIFPFEYQNESGEWVRAHIVVVNRENDGSARMLLWSMENINQEKSREMAIRKAEQERMSLLKTLASVALVIYRCEVRTDSAFLVHKAVEASGVWHEETSVKRLADTLTKEIDDRYGANRDEVIEFCSEASIKSRLADNEMISIDVLTKNFGWLRLNAITSQRNDNGVVTEYLLMLRKVDDLKQAELDKAQNEAERAMVLSGISNTFNFMYRFDLKEGLAYEITAPDYLSEAIPSVCTFDEARDIFIDLECDEENLPILEDFISLENMDEKFSENEYLTIDVKLKRYGWAQIAQSPLAWENGKVTEILWMARHIGREKEQELAAERMEQERTTLFKSMSNMFFAMYHLNLRDNTCEEINPVTGTFSSDVRSLEDTIKAFEKAFLTPEVEEADKDFWDVRKLPEKLRRTDVISKEVHTERTGWVRFFILTFRRDEQGEVTEILWTFTNIDDQKKHELEMNAALETALEDARQANMAKSRFLSAMSHDIRTPMNAVMGMIDIAKHHEDDREKVHENLIKIETAGSQLLSLVNDILDISAIESGKLELRLSEFSISQQFNRIETIFRPQIEQRNMSGEFVLRDIAEPWVIADETRINQITTNLMSNAVKYTGEGGTVRYEVYQSEDADGQLCMYFIVKDTGIGMSREYMDHMWETFSRATDTRINKIQGAGLGLSIVKDLVDKMDGTITVESRIDHGTTFTVKIPVTATEQMKHEEISQNPCDEEVSYRVLVAEDNDMNWEIACELLDINGISAVRAEDGKKCLEKFTEAPAGTYDCILMDMQMPVMNGLDATVAIRNSEHEEAKSIPIIAMTANAFAEDVQRCVKAGMNDHLSKPIDITKVIATIRKYARK